MSWFLSYNVLWDLSIVVLNRFSTLLYCFKTWIYNNNNKFSKHFKFLLPCIILPGDEPSLTLTASSSHWPWPWHWPKWAGSLVRTQSLVCVSASLCRWCPQSEWRGVAVVTSCWVGWTTEGQTTLRWTGAPAPAQKQLFFTGLIHLFTGLIHLFTGLIHRFTSLINQSSQV